MSDQTDPAKGREPVHDGWQDAGEANLAPSKIECRTVAGQRILIVRDGVGTWFALSPDCSHAALPLEDGRIRGNAILCPHHGARFDLRSGRALGPPAWTGIASWPVRIVAERVEVRL